MVKHPTVAVVNKDGTIRAHSCTIQQIFSKEPDGPVTHVAVFWYENEWDKTTGAVHIVAIEDILYERGIPEYAYISRVEPELVVSRMAIPETLRNLVYDRDGRKCVKCGNEDDLSIDHIFPFSKGGKTELNNLQTLCMKCNRKKRASIDE